MKTKINGLSIKKAFKVMGFTAVFIVLQTVQAKTFEEMFAADNAGVVQETCSAKKEMNLLIPLGLMNKLRMDSDPKNLQSWNPDGGLNSPHVESLVRCVLLQRKRKIEDLKISQAYKEGGYRRSDGKPNAVLLKGHSCRDLKYIYDEVPCDMVRGKGDFALYLLNQGAL